MKKIRYLIFIAAILTQSTFIAVSSQDAFVETHKDQLQQIKQSILKVVRPESQDIPLKGFDTDNNNDENTTTNSDGVGMVTDQYVTTPGTLHINDDMKQDIGLKRINESQSRPPHLRLNKEDTTIESITKGSPPDVKYRVRLRRRSVKSSSHSVGKTECSDEPYWNSIPFGMAISGWLLFFLVTYLNIHLKCRRDKIRVKNKDIEKAKASSQDNTISITHNELKLYHDLSERRNFIKNVTSEIEYSELKFGVVDAVDVIIDVEVDKEDENRECEDAQYEDRQYDDSEYVEREYGDTEYVEREHGDREYGDTKYGDTEYKDKEYYDEEYEDRKYYDEEYDMYEDRKYGEYENRQEYDREYEECENREYEYGEYEDIQFVKSDEMLRRQSSMYAEPSFSGGIPYSQSDIVHDRKRNENRKLIRRRSSSDVGRFSEDSLSYAASILALSEDERHHNKLASNRRQVVREGTSQESNGSFLNEVATKSENSMGSSSLGQ